LDGIGTGLGVGFGRITVGCFRELVGSGKLLGMEVLPLVSNGGWDQPNGLMLLAPSAFFLIGFLIWVIRVFNPEQVEA
ncbi:NADH:ubiquinone reductase (Na(+)-transporting) subunit D, partial [Vibrio parahaemolyticus]|nr:NADH:ubiquinone reductase (Na(+)-transporting) subunit D [Vibrio parahaemolyticus]